MLKILEKFMQDPDTDPKPTEKQDPDPKKIIPDPGTLHWFKTIAIYYK